MRPRLRFVPWNPRNYALGEKGWVELEDQPGMRLFYLEFGVVMEYTKRRWELLPNPELLPPETTCWARSLEEAALIFKLRGSVS